MDSSNSKQRCRACLISGDNMYHLEEKYNNSKNLVMHNLWQLLQSCASVQLSFDEDSFPRFICGSCLKKANESYQFRLQCESADLQLRAELERKNGTKKKFALSENDDSLITSSLPHLSHQFSTEPKPTEENLQIVSNTGDDDPPETAVQRKQVNDVPIKQRTCDQCGKEFKYRASMIKHKRKHGKTSRSCVYCDESLATAALLARHMEQTHAHLKTVKCSQCGKGFFKQANLRLHMNVHSGVKRHMCEVCGVSFALAGNLAAHRRLHTGLKPYTCKQCGRSFAQQAALRSHEAGHSDRKDHICSECGAAFSRAGALRNHCKRHLPVRPFVCSLCGKAFTFSSERKRHMTIHTGEKNHECNICGSRFNRSTNLAVHRRIHTGETPHVCSLCGKRFSQSHCLRTHMAATHPCTF